MPSGALQPSSLSKIYQISYKDNAKHFRFMYAGLPGRTKLEIFVDIKKLYICSNSTRHASRRTVYQDYLRMETYDE